MSLEGAACRGRTDLFFTPADAPKALALCRTCPVIAACRELGRSEPYGVWGGRLHLPAGEGTKAERRLAGPKLCRQCWRPFRSDVGATRYCCLECAQEARRLQKREAKRQARHLRAVAS